MFGIRSINNNNLLPLLEKWNHFTLNSCLWKVFQDHWNGTSLG